MKLSQVARRTAVGRCRGGIVCLLLINKSKLKWHY